WALLVLPLACGQEVADQRSGCELPPQPSFQRVRPVGGWDPYGGGLLHWWNPCCFPHRGAPDDYCRKPLPNVCWPPYPPYYIWAPSSPANCNHGVGQPNSSQARD